MLLNNFVIEKEIKKWLLPTLEMHTINNIPIKVNGLGRDRGECIHYMHLLEHQKYEN